MKITPTPFVPVALLILMAGGAFAGCRPFPFAHSGLTESLTSRDLLQGLAVSGGGGIIHDSLARGGVRGFNIEFAREFEVEMPRGTPGSLMHDFCEEVLRRIMATGASIRHNGQIAPGNGPLRDFDYRYHWAANEGIIRVYSAPISPTRIRIILYSYEHRR